LANPLTTIFLRNGLEAAPTAICELGHWIEPAIVFRWAEERGHFAKLGIRSSQIIDKLLVSPTWAGSTGCKGSLRFRGRKGMRVVKAEPA
jgi:hypothetical protein